MNKVVFNFVARIELPKKVYYLPTIIHGKNRMSKNTPMMEQYYRLKRMHPDTLLFFRMGDFYEMFGEDAKIASKELDIVLTSRDKDKEDPIPMAGIPFHSVESYLQRMIKKGYKVAIAEQVEDPSEAKGLVRRDIVRVVTPGTVVDEGLLEGKGNNYLMCLCGSGPYGAAFVDISTGDFFVTELEDEEEVMAELLRFEPSECITTEKLTDDDRFVERLKRECDTMVHGHREESFLLPVAKAKLMEHFGTETIESLGLENKDMAVRAAGAAYDYLEDTQKRAMEHIKRLQYYSGKEHMILDATTLRNLEIFKNMRDGGKKDTLLDVMDDTLTAMGSRRLKAWIQRPLTDLQGIESRLNAVQDLTDDLYLRDDIRDKLKGIADLERLISRIIYGTANPRDMLMIRNTLERIKTLKELLKEVKSDKLIEIEDNIDTLKDVKDTINSAITEEPPTSLREGGFIKEGYDEKLDELRELTRQGKDWINTVESQERKRTGISKLKVGYNKVHGYYIEVPRNVSHKVPDEYSRKQTLKNAERYYTEELKRREEEILSAEEKMVALEYDIFQELREDISNNSSRFQQTSHAVGELDVLANFSYIALRNDYSMPEMSTDDRIVIREGRHPVVERSVDGFVSNDSHLDMGKNNFLIITGPNMAGKSTYMRQIAHITLMAHVGSFVPAEEAHIGLVDRIFTRVGSLDALTKGQSTFMVEMVELAKILHNASKNSLVLLDEIGSGTSTFDGLSIAWSVTEYITREIGAKTLFATHYHELTELERAIEGVKNLHVATKEDGGTVTFLRKVREGHTDESYGVHVAALAGVPKTVVERAREVLKQIEEEHTVKMEDVNSPKFTQLVFDVKGGTSKDTHPVIRELKNLDIDNITPLDAMNVLWKLKKRTEEQ